jgi:hypothetical protein
MFHRSLGENTALRQAKALPTMQSHMDTKRRDVTMNLNFEISPLHLGLNFLQKLNVFLKLFCSSQPNKNHVNSLGSCFSLQPLVEYFTLVACENVLPHIVTIDASITVTIKYNPTDIVVRPASARKQAEPSHEEKGFLKRACEQSRPEPGPEPPGGEKGSQRDG